VAPALFVAAVLLLVQALRFGRFSWYDESLLGYLLTMVIVFFNIPWGFGEEYGWRGYLLPKLLGLGEVKAGLIVGLVWAPWHFPVVLAGHAFPNQPPVRALLLFTVSVVLFSLILTRLWVWSGGSLLAVILAHMSVNLYAGYLEPPYLTGNPLLVNMGGAVSLTLATVLVVALYRRRRGTDTDTSVDTTVNTRATEG
jgi:membrane protease YdiL (CAAX protease family)